ncbi:unnamed protein product [Gadus morhua 'NCC']
MAGVSLRHVSYLGLCICHCSTDAHADHTGDDGGERRGETFSTSGGVRPNVTRGQTTDDGRPHRDRT